MAFQSNRPSRADFSWRSTPIPLIYFPQEPGSAPEPVPFVMTATEVIRFTRIDQTGVKHGERSLEHYRQQGSLRATQIGRELRYLLPNVLDFLDAITELNPH